MTPKEASFPDRVMKRGPVVSFRMPDGQVKVILTQIFNGYSVGNSSNL
jgi:hypothetical protein